MPTPAKGASIPVNGQSVEAVLSWETSVANDSIDISALLLTESGRVRDDDFIFYNQPQHRSGAVAHPGRVTNARVAETLDVQFDKIEPEITRILFVASIHQGDSSGVRNMRLDLESPGVDSIAFLIEGCTTEAALVSGELYRRADRWKFRAVGQGYDTGLAGIATDFGITVDEDPPELARPAPAAVDTNAPPMWRADPPPQAPNVQAVPSWQAPPPTDPASESLVAPWYRVKSNLSVDFSTSVSLPDVAQTFKQVIRSRSRKAQFESIQQLSDPFDQFNDNAEFAAVAIAKEFTKMWAVQIYIYELGSERGVTLRVIGESGFARASDGFQNSYSRTSGRKRADDVIAALRRIDRQLAWLTD